MANTAKPKRNETKDGWTIQGEVFLDRLRNRAETQSLRVLRSRFRGKDLIHVRTFFRDDEYSEWLPGRGVTLRPDEVGEVVAALTAAMGQDGKATAPKEPVALKEPAESTPNNTGDLFARAGK